MRTRICIVAAKRTPQGRFMGALSKYSPLELGAAAGKAALTNIDPARVEMVIVGRVLPPDYNVARQISRAVGVPIEATAFTVNMACASGMKAIMLAADAVTVGKAQVVLAGGVESMTNAPHLLDRARAGYKFGDITMKDSLAEGLRDQQLDEGMGITAERLAGQYNIDRRSQDAFAYRSHMKAVAAQDTGVFDAEMVALPELAKDEHPRRDTSIEKLGTLRPAFKVDGTVTPGNASGVNDGAAMVVLCSEKTAEREGWKPLAYLRAAAEAGCDPRIMGIGPVPATRKLCQQNSLSINDFDTLELNEAFAAQALACLCELTLSADDSRLNRHGSGIALGHPVGATGARLVVHLAHQIAAGKSSQALATLCVGGGQGAAMALTGH